MKIKIAIKHYLTGAVLFEFEKENNTIKDTLLAAIKAGSDLRYSDLRYSDLSYSDLSYSDLRYSDLSYSDLRYSDLSYSNLSYSNLSYSNLSYSNLRYSDLSYSNLSYSNLRYSDLSYSNLSGAKNIPDRWLDYWWHVHHEILVEQLFEPIHNRINYIKTDKPKEEIETRLRLLKPVLGKIPTTEKGWERLHKKECKSCPWNSEQGTIFPKEDKI